MSGNNLANCACFSGRLKKQDSLLKHINGTSCKGFERTDFVPIFLDELLASMTDAEKQRANTTCKGDNKECMFDLTVTGKHVSYRIVSTYLIINQTINVCSLCLTMRDNLLININVQITEN